MTKTISFVLPKGLLLPEIDEFRMVLSFSDTYFSFLANVARVLRDSWSEISNYRGEGYEEYVIHYLEDMRATAPNVYELCNTYLGEVLNRATTFNSIMPSGIFEELRLLEVTHDNVAFLGILHAIDYR